MSTIAALGAFYVTCWQSLSQIQHRYGTLADTVLGGHRSKLFFAGIDDAATLNYLHTVTGSEHVARRSWSADVWAGIGRGRRSISESQQREELVPNHLVRTMLPGEAVMLHGTLPPVHVRAVRWWTERRLADLFPAERPTVRTCPLTGTAATPAGPVLDASTLEMSRTQLPPASIGPPSSSNRQAANRRGETRGQMALPVDHQDPKPVEPEHAALQPNELVAAPAGVGLRAANRVAGRCERCREPVATGDGEVVRLGSRDVTRHWPECPNEPRSGTLSGTSSGTSPGT